MRLLLDTHAFLWFITGDEKLSATAEHAIRAGANELLLSTASIWEMAIKVRLGRLPIPEPLDTFVPAQLRINQIQVLPIELRHTYEVARLPLHHGDPFDRLLICQSRMEDLPIISADAAFKSYGVRLVW